MSQCADVKESHAECPVCGADAPLGRAPGLLFQGKRWYFDGAACRLAFKREPERWAAARPDAGRAPESALPPRTRGPGPFRVR